MNKIKNKGNTNTKIVLIIVLVILLALLFLFGRESRLPAQDVNNIPSSQILPDEDVDDAVVGLADGNYCFIHNEEILPGALASNMQEVVLKINGTEITGTKKGTQNGPEMFDGYYGTLSGIKGEGGMMELTYAYTVEGSQGKQLEVYKFDNGKLIELQWPLKDENGTLVPDRTLEPTMITYTTEICK